MRRQPRLLLLLAVAVLLAACRPELFNAPTDGLELQVRFEHVDNLVVGHEVQIADVGVGVVSAIELDGHVAVVDLLIEDTPVPVGTTASVARTSLLGEDHVALTYPEGDATELPSHAPGDELPAGPPSRGLEDVTTEAVELLAAVSGEDIASVVDAAAEITGGRETQISDLVAEVAGVTEHYAAQRDALDATITTVGELGRELATNREAFTTLLDDVDAATELLVEQRHRMVDTLQAFGSLADAAEGSILGDTRASFERTLIELGPVLAAFTEDPDRLPRLIDQLLLFVDRIPDAVREDELELFGLITIGLGDLVTGGAFTEAAS